MWGRCFKTILSQDPYFWIQVLFLYHQSKAYVIYIYGNVIYLFKQTCAHVQGRLEWEIKSERRHSECYIRAWFLCFLACFCICSFIICQHFDTDPQDYLCQWTGTGCTCILTPTLDKVFHTHPSVNAALEK